MNTDVYISLSSQCGRLIVDGNLELLREFLDAMRRGLSLADAPAINSHAAQPLAAEAMGASHVTAG